MKLPGRYFEFICRFRFLLKIQLQIDLFIYIFSILFLHILFSRGFSSKEYPNFWLLICPESRAPEHQSVLAPPASYCNCSGRWEAMQNSSVSSPDPRTLWPPGQSFRCSSQLLGLLSLQSRHNLPPFQTAGPILWPGVPRGACEGQQPSYNNHLYRVYHILRSEKYHLAASDHGTNFPFAFFSIVGLSNTFPTNSHVFSMKYHWSRYLINF